MIISSKQIQSIMKAYTDQNKVSQSQKTQSASPVSKKDEVILSSQAQEVGQLYQAIRALPEVREDRVREISAKIAQGTYDVDAQAVAEKMLARTFADGLR
ncbi:MAG TPA: flagellar biosynthesis anti-sigma factor FlgM [Selenomonadales bacterium]|nr:flagellar biosynthesis anti-sigma factor FlgM [Selenomonadales bacterium]